ncbi:serine/threonine protein kinase [Nocardia sp. NPDC058640]
MHSLRSDDPKSIGPYELLGVLGSGGMGRIYLGRIGKAGQAVAVKVIRPDLADDTEFRIRFRREVAAARRVKGKHTAALLDADVEADHPWLATEFVAGVPLDDAVREHNALPEESVILLAVGLVDALTDIHNAGIVHRDLKPSNILLTTEGPRVIDFGIARAADDTVLTATGQFIGSPGYMAPEQIAGTDGQGSSGDIFALGGVLVFAATGRNPFGSGDHVSMLWRVMYQEVDFGSVPMRLRPVLAACMAKEPDSRPTLTQLREQFDVLKSLDRPKWLPSPIYEAASRRDSAFLDGWSADGDDGGAASYRLAAVPLTPDAAPSHGFDEDPNREISAMSRTPPTAEKGVVSRRRSGRLIFAGIGIGALILGVATSGYLMFGDASRNSDYASSEGSATSVTSVPPSEAVATVTAAQPTTTSSHIAVATTVKSATESPAAAPPAGDLPDSFAATWSGIDPLSSGPITVIMQSGNIGDVIGTMSTNDNILGCTVSTLTLVSVSESQVKTEYRGSSPGCIQGSPGTYATFTISGENVLSMLYSGSATPLAFVQQLYRTS